MRIPLVASWKHIGSTREGAYANHCVFRRSGFYAPVAVLAAPDREPQKRTFASTPRNACIGPEEHSGSGTDVFGSFGR